MTARTTEPHFSRLDAELVRRGLARSRGHARELLDTGQVRVDGAPATRASLPVRPSTDLAVEATGHVWVSRAAGKLLGALEGFGPRGPHVAGRRCLDVGASTGGFTQVLLHHGAAHVVALDVGRDQLVADLRDDPRVTDLPGTTIRGLRPDAIGGPVDLLVADLSFISLTLVLPTLAGLLTPDPAADAEAVLLVKPQFEVGRARLGKGGVVRSATDRASAVTSVAEAALAAGLHVRGLLASPVTGSAGNAEFLLWLARGADGAVGWEALVSTAEQLSREGAP